ncbi:MAG: N-acetylneuraminate synthase family protein, partial [Flavobacteriales bacterium]
MKLVSFLNNYNPRVLHNPYVIAEAGVNHEGSMELAKRLIDEAAEGGAHAIKFQTYKAETIASKDSPYYWDITKEPTRSQFELFKKYDKFWKKEYEELARYCETAGIEFMSTPFDVESATFLNDLM